MHSDPVAIQSVVLIDRFPIFDGVFPFSAGLKKFFSSVKICQLIDEMSFRMFFRAGMLQNCLSVWQTLFLGVLRLNSTVIWDKACAIMREEMT